MLGPKDLPSSSIAYVWRFRDPIPGWDDYATINPSTLWRAQAPISFVLQRAGRDGIYYVLIEDDNFVKEQERAGCVVSFGDMFKRTLGVFVQNSRKGVGLETVDWDMLREAVFSGEARVSSCEMLILIRIHTIPAPQQVVEMARL
jgi:hypothetical protein